MPGTLLNGIDLYYESHGSGPAVVFAHGRGGNHLSWWQQVPVFAKAYRCITFDHRGFGQSRDLPDGPGRAAFVEDLRALLDHLGVPGAYLVGQSMGGWTCLGFAVKYRERVKGLVLADTSAGIADASIISTYRERGDPPADVTQRALSASFRQRDPVRAFLYAQFGLLSPPPREPLMALLTSEDGPRAPDLATLQIPTMFIVGSDDVVVPPRIAEMACRLVPNARFEVVSDAGHSVYFEKPDEFNELVGRFLAEVESGTWGRATIR